MNTDMTPQEDLRALRDYVLLNERPKADAWRFVAKSCELAADRIEALEAALREIDALAEVSSNTRHALTRCRAIARTALEASS